MRTYLLPFRYHSQHIHTDFQSVCFVCYESCWRTTSTCHSIWCRFWVLFAHGDKILDWGEVWPWGQGRSSDEFWPSAVDVIGVVLVLGCEVDYVVLELDSSWATFGFVVFSEAFGTQYLYPRVADSWTSYCLRDNFPMDIYMKGLRSLFWLALKINQFIKLFVKFKVVSCIIFLCGLSIMVTHEIKHKWVGIWSVLLTWYRIGQLLRFGIIMGLNPGQGQVII